MLKIVKRFVAQTAIHRACRMERVVTRVALVVAKMEIPKNASLAENSRLVLAQTLSALRNVLKEHMQ